MKKILMGALWFFGYGHARRCCCDSFGHTDEMYSEDGDGSNAKIKFRKAHIAGAGMLAIAQGGAAVKAEGDVTVGLGYPDETPDTKPRDLGKIQFID